MREGLIPEVARHESGGRIVVDGAAGEGGGQILRSSLALSLVTGRAFRIDAIRGRRSRPGLLRQHYTAVGAAAAICGARVSGHAVGSSSLDFTPGPVRAGQYRFAVGTAGSSGLVFQTVLPALATAAGGSHLVLEGGTHNPCAPPFEFLERSFAPALALCGPVLDLSFERPGFYPAGGGRWTATVEPVAAWRPLDLTSRGALRSRAVRAVRSTGLPADVTRRECEAALHRLGWEAGHAEEVEWSHAACEGNVLQVEVAHERVTELATGFGARGVPAKRVAREPADQVNDYLASEAAVGRHLADQLLLPMALAAGGRISTVSPSRHTLTNIAVIQAFTGVRFSLEKLARNHWMIEARRAGAPAGDAHP